MECRSGDCNDESMFRKAPEAMRQARISSKRRSLCRHFALRPSLQDDLVSSCPAACRFNSDMQIVFGACLFVIAVILLAYVPGKLLLIALKRTVSPLEDVTLACVLGLGGERPCLLVNHVCSPGTFLLPLAADRCRRFCLAQSKQTEITLETILQALSRFPKEARPRRATRPYWSWPGFWRLESSRWHISPVITRISHRSRMARCASIRYLMCCFTSRSLTS